MDNAFNSTLRKGQKLTGSPEQDSISKAIQDSHINQILKSA